MKSSYRISSIENTTAQAYVKRYLHFLNFKEAILRIIEMYSYHSEKLPKVSTLS